MAMRLTGPKAYWSDTDQFRICLPFTAYHMRMCYLRVRYLLIESHTKNKSPSRGLDCIYLLLYHYSINLSSQASLISELQPFVFIVSELHARLLLFSRRSMNSSLV